MAIEVDLYSDTVTRPTPEMRRFMCEADVGDEQKHEDPTVNLLQEMVAELLGKEAALFLPSGTMCNEIALRVHCRHGEEMLAHKTAHPIHFEAGGPAALAGVNVQALDGPRGQYDAATLEAAIRPDNRHMPRSRLAWVEQTSNLGGGSIWPLDKVRAVTDVARRRGLSTHMDGARLMNAVVASGISAQQWAAPFDSAWIDFTKGLGAPVGAAIAGSRDFIAEAWRLKQQMGGAMRQAGIIAAGGVYALEHHVKRLAEDHANAKRLAEGLAALPGIALDPATVETNLVFFDLTGALDAPAAVERMLARGVRMGALGPRTIRAVTHLDVSAQGIERALDAAKAVFKDEPGGPHPLRPHRHRHAEDGRRGALPRGRAGRRARHRPPIRALHLGHLPLRGRRLHRDHRAARRVGLPPPIPRGERPGLPPRHLQGAEPRRGLRARRGGRATASSAATIPTRTWKEAFLHPKQALGIVVQFAQPGPAHGTRAPLHASTGSALTSAPRDAAGPPHARAVARARRDPVGHGASGEDGRRAAGQPRLQMAGLVHEACRGNRPGPE